MLLALKDHQLAIVTAMADSLTGEKRAIFLNRIAARLRLRGTHFSDTEIEQICRQALFGLRPNAA